VISKQPPKPLQKPPLSFTSEKTLLVCDKVTKAFGKFKAVDKVSLEAKKGEILGLLGPNGAGKTTLIKMMCGLLEPTEGDIFIAGYNVKRERAKVWQLIGYMSQKFSLYRDLTVMENVNLYAGLYGITGQDFSELLTKLGLSSWEERLVKDVPFGIRQRVALMCAILHNPLIVFLDEPTSGVDPVARRSFWEIIYYLSREKGITVIVSTHYMDEAENCDRIGLMNRGRLIAVGTPEELKITSETLAGKLLKIKTPRFKEAYTLLKNNFPNLYFYGNKLFLRTFTPEKNQPKISEILKTKGIEEYTIEITLPPLQEAFVDFILKDLKENP
jgi:ABC-2 type transport system ATP-binding protein